MTRTKLALCAAAFGLLLTPTVAAPDTKTTAKKATPRNLSGTWEMDGTRSESPHATESTAAVKLVIKQTPTEISVETQKDGQTETIVYNADGTETEKPASDNGPYKWRATWDGPKLMTEVQRNVNRATVTILEVYDLAPNKKELTVERTLTVQHGYQMRGAKNYASAKDVFVKAR